MSADDHFDPKARAAEKQASRDADDAALASLLSAMAELAPEFATEMNT